MSYKPGGKTHPATDYDHEIPCVVIDLDPGVDDLKAAFFAQIESMLRGGLANRDQIAEVVATSRSIKDLAGKQKNPLNDYIARRLMDACENFEQMNLTAAEKAFDDFRTDFLLGLVPRLPEIKREHAGNNISEKVSQLREQLFKIIH